MRIFLIIFLLATGVAKAQSPGMELAKTAMANWPDSFSVKANTPAKWTYDQGVVLKGIEGIWERTGEGRWFTYIQKSMDFYVGEEGSIRTYKESDYNLDNVNNGKLLLTLYQVTGKEKYKKAADRLRAQLRSQPRTSEGGFWHKKVYPNQMWLDGLYMAEPFYAAYARLFHEDTAFSDITRQFVLIDKHLRPADGGLYRHGWDESRQQKWADGTTGLSPNAWARALGWYGMALVDALDYFPQEHPGRDSLIRILNRFAKDVTKWQDGSTGLWYDVPDQPKQAKNYLEASASCMMVYTLAKGVRMGYLPATYTSAARKGYQGLRRKFYNNEGTAHLNGTVSVSGLGGNPYRDGSFAYYMGEPVVTDDPKGMGAFINADNEIQILYTLGKGKGKTVLLDEYFNNEWKKDATGTNIRYHYTWDDHSNSGFSTLGSIFNRYGATTSTLEEPPTAALLKSGDIYIIVDPDTEKETRYPNFMDAARADVIADWVKGGGVLILMANDSGNTELKNFNTLASRFGIRFNLDNFNQVQGNQFEQGAIMPAPGNVLFPTADKVYIKELSTLDVSKPAMGKLFKEDKTIVAVASYGKGTVLAVGDPWFYNEYTDGRKLPSDFKNYQAAEDLVRWAISQIPKKKKS